MASEAQQNKGYILPTPITGWDLICVRLKIPDAPEYRAAFRGQLKGLTEWWNWEKGDTKGSEAATYWRQIIHEHLVIQDCDELELFGGDMAQFGVCWKLEECGYVLYYTLNGNCSQTKVLDCDGNEVCFPTTNTPPDPINDPIDTPPNNGWLSNCQIVNIAIFNLVTVYMPAFLNNVLCIPSGGDTPLQSASKALTGWLRTYNLLTIPYHEAFQALMVKYLDTGCTLLSYYELEDTMWDYLKCEALLCMNGEITRAVMSCFADTIDGFPNVETTPNATFNAFFKDFISVYPVERVRSDVINANPLTVSDDCSGCDVTPTDDCGVAFGYPFKYAAVEETFGWITLPDGAANSWNTGAVDFGTRVLSPMSRYYGAGWRLFTGQTAAPYLAGAIQKNFDEPFHLCQAQAVGYGTTKHNTRLMVMWARVAGTSTWVPLGSQKLNIGVDAVLNIKWQGDLMIDRLLVVGATGGEYIIFESVYVNWAMT